MPAADRIDEPHRERSAPRGRFVWPALAVLTAVAVFAVALAAAERQHARDAAHSARSRNDARATAVAFGLALYTYDSADLAAARAQVLRYATARFAGAYNAANGAPTSTEMARLKARESARVAGAFMTDIVHGGAGAIVVLDTTVQSTSGTTTAVAYLQVSLVEQAGRWKVDAATPLASRP